MNWNDGSSPENKLWEAEKRIKKLEAALHVIRQKSEWSLIMKPLHEIALDALKP